MSKQNGATREVFNRVVIESKQEDKPKKVYKFPEGLSFTRFDAIGGCVLWDTSGSRDVVIDQVVTNGLSREAAIEAVTDLVTRNGGWEENPEGVTPIHSSVASSVEEPHAGLNA